jgi:hypothetical protein
MPKRKRHVKYMVDYDLRQNSKGRGQFYRKLKTLNVEKSTQSVVLTNDLEKAKIVHHKASNMGKSNIYKVEKKRRRK